MAANHVDGKALNSALVHCRNHLVEHAQLQLAGIHFEMTPRRRFIIGAKKMGSAARKICGTPKFVSLLERAQRGRRRCLPSTRTSVGWEGGSLRSSNLCLLRLRELLYENCTDGTLKSYVLPCQATTKDRGWITVSLILLTIHMQQLM